MKNVALFARWLEE